MRINWKKTVMVVLDLTLAAYLALAFTTFNHPDKSAQVCEEVSINITDQETSGFLSANEIKNILQKKHLYPKGKTLALVDPRTIEESLSQNTLIDHVQCYKTVSGTVGIIVSQKVPYVRIKTEDGKDYYLDANGEVMRSTNYTSDLIIATGNISKWYAQNYISAASRYIMSHDFWKNQIEQINILPDKNFEIVPRVGNHIVCLGRLPESTDKEKREKDIQEFMDFKLKRLEKFYKYGLNEIGWNKYNYINLEFDNQIICKKNKKTHKEAQADVAKQVTTPAPTSEKKETQQQEKQEKPRNIN